MNMAGSSFLKQVAPQLHTRAAFRLACQYMPLYAERASHIMEWFHIIELQL